MSVDIDVRGADELRRELEKVMGPELKKALQRATNASGKFLKPFVQAAAPRRTGRLRRSISSRQARRNRPATVITARPRIAYYRHMVIDGTRAHRIRFPDQKAVGVAKSQGNIRHPGATANPFIGRAASQHEQAAFDVARRIIDEELP